MGLCIHGRLCVVPLHVYNLCHIIHIPPLPLGQNKVQTLPLDHRILCDLAPSSICRFISCQYTLYKLKTHNDLLESPPSSLTLSPEVRAPFCSLSHLSKSFNAHVAPS